MGYDLQVPRDASSPTFISQVGELTWSKEKGSDPAPTEPSSPMPSARPAPVWVTYPIESPHCLIQWTPLIPPHR